MGRFFGPTPNVIASDGFFRGSAAPASGHRFIAVGSDGGDSVPFVSVRVGGVWAPPQSPAVFGAQGVNSVAFATGQWLAGSSASAGNSVIATSPDGGTWTPQTNPIPGVDLNVCGGDAHFANFGGNHQSVITSPNGTAWTESAPIFGGSSSLQASAANGSGTYVLSAGTSGGQGIAFSVDGTTFTLETTLTTDAPNQVIWDGTQFVVIYGAGGIQSLATSPDGANWTALGALTFADANSIAYNGSVYVLVSSTSTNAAVAATPAALVTATPTSIATNPLLAITAGAGLFVAVGFTAVAYTSTDGVTWNTESTGIDPANQLNAIAYH